MLFIPAYLAVVCTSHMEDTPTLMAATRPAVPNVGTPEYARWSKESSIAFDGGTLTAAYGNLIQTLDMDAIGFSCSAATKQVSVTSSAPVLTIGQPPISRKTYTYTKKQFNKKNAGSAAAGEPVRIVTSVGEYTARLTGSIESLATFLCTNSAAIYDAFDVYSPRGAAYGPFTPSSI